MKRTLSTLSICLLSILLISAQNYTLHQNIPYDTISGISSNLLSLDIYEPTNVSGPRPVVIYVHGGSWKGGSKTNVGHKAQLFTDSSYVFVSVNYRLSPEPPDNSIPDAVRFPNHPRDVAKAIKEVYMHIHRYSGDNQNMHLIGHSAGAHLINLVSTNEKFLGAFGLSPADIRCVCSLDAGVFDLSFEIAVADASRKLMLLSAFGTDTTLYSDASPLFNIPLFNIQPNEQLPGFFLVHQNTPQRILKTEGFRDSLLAAGHTGGTFNADPYNHGLINTAVGHPADTIGLTRRVITFINRCSDLTSPVYELQNIESYPSIRLFPNPTRGIIHFDSDLVEKVQIFNSRGRLMGVWQIENSAVNISAFDNGLYIFRMLNQQKIIGLQKLIKID